LWEESIHEGGHQDHCCAVAGVAQPQPVFGPGKARGIAHLFGTCGYVVQGSVQLGGEPELDKDSVQLLSTSQSL
jgi:hypothetical protein